MTRTTHRGAAGLLAMLLALLLSLSLVAPAVADDDESRESRTIGRYSDQSQWGDFSSLLTHALALLALERAEGTAPSDEAVDLLLDQQCEDGAFPDAFKAPTTAEDADCVGGVDTTAHVVMALDAIGEPDAADRAIDWLVSAQNDDGSFGGADGINSNSTGLAAIALELGQYEDEADDARDWLTAVQDPCETETPGALPFNAETRGEASMATSQGVLGFPATSLADLDATAASGEPTTGCDEGDEISDPAVAAADFLITQLTDETHLVVQDFPSVGGTIDVVFALAAVGTGDEALSDISDWLEGQVADYTVETDDDGPSGAYAGSSAKAALAMLVLGEDPRSTGGIDLIEQLEGLEVRELGDVTVTCDAEAVEPGDEVTCTIAGLVAAETVDVHAELNPTLFDETVTAENTGTAEFSFVVPDDATEDDEVTITVDGMGAPGLSSLVLNINVPVEEDEGEEPVEVTDEEAEEGEADEEVLPETGRTTGALGVLGLFTLLLGVITLSRSRRAQRASAR